MTINLERILFSEPERKLYESDIDSSIDMFHLRLESEAKESIVWHYHRECELFYVVEGEGSLIIGDNITSFKKGSMIFTGPDLPHCWVGNSRLGSSELIGIRFSADLFGENFLRNPEGHKLAILLKNACRGIEVESIVKDRIVGCLYEMRSQKDLMRLSLLFEVLHLLMQVKENYLTTDTYINRNRDLHGGRVDFVIDYIRKNMSREISQVEVADSVSMTPQAFSRYFKKSTGRTFVSFVNSVRIAEAAKQLLQTNDEIKTVANSCGYKSLSNFSKRFFGVHGCSPRDFRNKNRT